MLANLHVLSFPNQFPHALAQDYPLLVLFGATAWIAATGPGVSGEAAASCQTARGISDSAPE